MLQYPKDIVKCNKGPSQGGLPIAELRNLAKQMGIDTKGLKKAEICGAIEKLINKPKKTPVAKVPKTPEQLPLSVAAVKATDYQNIDKMIQALGPSTALENFTPDQIKNLCQLDQGWAKKCQDISDEVWKHLYKKHYKKPMPDQLPNNLTPRQFFFSPIRQRAKFFGIPVVRHGNVQVDEFPEDMPLEGKELSDYLKKHYPGLLEQLMRGDILNWHFVDFVDGYPKLVLPTNPISENYYLMHPDFPIMGGDFPYDYWSIHDMDISKDFPIGDFGDIHRAFDSIGQFLPSWGRVKRRRVSTGVMTFDEGGFLLNLDCSDWVFGYITKDFAEDLSNKCGEELSKKCPILSPRIPLPLGLLGIEEADKESFEEEMLKLYNMRVDASSIASEWNLLGQLESKVPYQEVVSLQNRINTLDFEDLAYELRDIYCKSFKYKGHLFKFNYSKRCENLLNWVKNPVVLICNNNIYPVMDSKARAE